MGTAGTMTGLGLGMKLMKPVVIRVGVTTAPKDRVPGPRSEALLAPVTFPWRDAIDNMQWVGSLEAYSLSMQLCRIGLLAGPSSGLSLQGLYQFLERAKVSGQLASLRQSIPKGEINCVFLCCDGPFQYIDEYMSKLPPASFGRIFNQVSKTVRDVLPKKLMISYYPYRNSLTSICIAMRTLGSSLSIRCSSKCTHLMSQQPLRRQ